MAVVVAMALAVALVVIVALTIVVVGKGKGNGNGVGGGPGNSADIQLWTVSDGHGFQVLQFTKSFTAQHKDLFENTVTSEQSR